MKRIMKKIITLLNILAIGFLFIFASCEVGLGEAVDMMAPVLNVKSPDNTGYILRTFEITGSAEDNIEIERMEILVEPLDDPNDTNSYKFRVSGNKWQQYDYSSQLWNDYNNQYSEVSGSKRSINWKLCYTFSDSVTTGTEFSITTQVYDLFGNDSPKSKDERSVTVDMNSPTVSIVQPSLRAYAAENSANYGLKDNSVIENLMNGTFTVKGSQKEDGRLSHLLVYLDEKTSPVITDAEKEPNALKNDSIAWKEVTGDNIRNWSADFNLSTISGYEHNRKTVRLVTESHDQAGNIEYNVQGWFTYWNDADIPWINATFGGDASTDRISVYPSSALQGQCYDDDGLKSITVKVYQGTSTTPVKTDTYDASNELNDKPKYFAWSVNALGGVCDFDVEVECEDINGKKAASVRRYLHVKDTNPPKIKITTDTTVPMLGDASGKVTLSGYVEDDAGVAALKIVRISEKTSAADLIKYYDKTYTEWNKVSASTKKANSNDNTMFWVELGSESGADHRRTFDKDFNIFTDFGIDGSAEKLITQQFVVMAIDTGGESKIDSFSWSGDSDAPTLTIDKLEVYANGASTPKETLNFATATTKKLKPYTRSTPGDITSSITDKIQISGTWSDNSTNIWTDKSKKGDLTLSIDGIGDVSVTVNNKGTWTTGKITPADSTTAVIYAEFADYAGNVKKVNDNFFVSSNLPELLRISTALSDDPDVKSGDGSYKAGDEIIVTLEFNKAVKYTGGTPSITLNVPASAAPENKKKISCTSPADTATSTYEFSYTVAADDDIAKLNVTAVNANGSVWTDSDGNNASLSIPAADSNKLSGTRSIKIDTVSPKIKAISAITSKGSYKAGDSIFMTIEFDEDVEIPEANLSNFKLGLNSTTNPTLSAKVTGPKTVLMTYSVKSGNNANPLKITITSEDYSGAGITDIAGNPLVDGVSTATLTGIIIDTGVPGQPVISNLDDTDFDDNAYVYDANGVTFKVTNIASDATVKQYSIDGGASWSNYTGSVNLKNNGTYTVTARQSDAAGNESSLAVAKTVTIDAGNLLTSVSAELPTGTYTTGNTIPIVLNFRRNVKVASGSTLTLNNSKTATIRSANVNTAATKLIYDYVVAEGDDINALNVNAIAGSFTDAAGHNVNDYIIGKIPSGKNLSDGRTLKIITGRPVVQSAALSKSNGNDVLTITFSRNIKKGAGNITLEHGTGYKAPSVISEADFINYKAKASSLANYYTLGTNGSDVNGNSDLTEKYILNYDIDTNNTNVIAALKTADADKVIIPVNSSYVTVNGSKLVITLSDSYAVPVKGADYSISIDAGVAKDSQNHSNELSNTFSVTHSGLEAPVVRVNKKRETTGATVTQPTTTGVKADCQTPGSTVTCVVYRQQTDQYSVTKKGDIPTKVTLNLTQNSTQSSYPFNIGVNDDTTHGFIYRINATAKKTGQTDVTAYEFAYRSVYTMTNVGGGDVGTTGSYAQVWVRGSDLPTGGISISSYPVSWNSEQFDKVRAMTNSTGNTWYWISWELIKPTYLQPLRGDMPSDAAENGPSVWSWGMQCYIPGLANHPLYPGQSITFNGNTNYYGANALSFYNKHCEYRNGKKVVKKKKS